MTAKIIHQKYSLMGFILTIIFFISPLMGFQTVSSAGPKQFGEQALRINGKYVSPEVFREERTRFFMRWRRNADMLRKTDEERNDLLLEEIINRVIIEDYLYNQSKVKVTSQETNDYIDRYIKSKYNTVAKMNDYLAESRINGMAGLKKNIELYLLKLKCFSRIARELGVTISQAEIETHYQHHRAENRKAVIRHILILDPSPDEAGKQAREIYRLLKNGADFSELAALHSADTQTKLSGGMLEPISRQETQPEIADLVFNAKAGDLLSPFQTRQGYEIIYVEKFIDFYHPLPEFAEMILLEKFGGSDQYQNWLAGLKSKQKIEILDPAFKAYRFYRAGRFNQAGSWYEKAYAVQKNENHLIRAIESYLEEKNWAKLTKLGQTGINKYPAQVPYYLHKAEGLYRTGKVKDALNLMKKTEALAKNNAYYTSLVGQLYSKLGFEDEAARVRQKTEIK